MFWNELLNPLLEEFIFVEDRAELSNPPQNAAVFPNSTLADV